MAGPPARPAIEEAITLAADLRRIWRAIVDAEDRSHWWGYFHLDARPGGCFEERWTDGAGRPRVTSGRVTKLVEPTTLCLSWSDDGWTAATDVEIQLRQADCGTSTVRVRHSGWERLQACDGLVEQHREGWKAHLRDLRDHLGRQAAHRAR